jgi:hypothetical protein
MRDVSRQLSTQVIQYNLDWVENNGISVEDSVSIVAELC